MRTRVERDPNDASRERIVIDFATKLEASTFEALDASAFDLVSANAKADPVANPFALRKASVATDTAHPFDRITLVLENPLPRARRFKLVVKRDLRTEFGLVETGTTSEFATAGPRVAAVAALEQDASVRRFFVGFDMRLDLAALDRALLVRDEAGKELTREVRDLVVDATEGGDEVGDRDAIGIVSGFEIRLGDGAPNVVRVAIADTLRAREGDVPLESTENEWRVDLVAPLGIESVAGTSDRIDVMFDRQIVDPDAPWITLEPRVDFSLFRIGLSGVRLTGQFEPGETYTVTLAAGFPGKGLARLEKALLLPVRIADSEPTVGFVDDGIVLSSLARPEIAVFGMNVETVVVRAKQVYDNNALHFLRQQRSSADSDPDPAFSGGFVERTFPISAARNTRFEQRVDLREMLGKPPRGMFLVEVFDREQEWRVQRELIAITDLRIAFRATRESALVHVASLASGAPTSGASVELLSKTNQRLAQGVTDERGFAMLAFVGDETPFCVVARKDEDTAFVDLSHFEVDPCANGSVFAADAAERDYLRKGQLEAFVATDRGIVRPGESAHVVALVRDDTLAASRRPLRVKWYDPAQRVRGDQRLDPSAGGILVFDVATDPSDPLGYWRVDVQDAATEQSIGGTSFRVATVTPPRIEVAAKFEEALAFGSRGAIEIDAHWLSGAPLVSARATVSVHLSPQSFVDESGFEFGGVFESADLADPRHGALPSITTALDEAGHARVEFDVPPLSPASPETKGQFLRALATIEVEDPGGRVVTRSLEGEVLPKDYRIGARWTKDGLDLVALVGGSSASLSPYRSELTVVVELVRRSYEWTGGVPLEIGASMGRRGRVHVRPRSERYVETRSVVKKVDVTIRNGAAHVDAAQLGVIGDPGYGSLFISVGSQDRRVDVPVTSSAPRPDELVLTALGDRFAPGDRIPLEIDSPMKGVALITVEGGGIHAATRAVLEAGKNQVAIDLPRNGLPPSAYVIATLARPQKEMGGSPEDADRASLFSCSTVIEIDCAEHVGALTLEAPRAVEPGSMLEAKVHATRFGPGSECVVLAVDRGALFGAASPAADPREFFLAKRRLDSRGADSALALRHGAIFDVSAPGGDGDFDSIAAGRIEATGVDQRSVVLMRRVDLDANGEATVQLDLGAARDYEGRLALIAIASGAQRFGCDFAETIVKAPLSIAMSTPHVVRRGDRFEVPVTVRNSTGVAGDLTLDIACGENLALSGSGPTIRVPLAIGEERTLYVPVLVDDQETSDARVALSRGEVRVQGKLGAFERTVVAAFSIAPQRPITTSREAIAFGSDSERTLTVDPSFEGNVRVRLVLDGHQESRLAAAERELLDYPYGCTEQVSSQLLARIGAAHMTLVGDGDEGKERVALDAFVHVGLQKIFSAQTAAGGFSFWRDSAEEYPLPTLHALEAMLELSDRGFPVPEGALKRAAAHAAREFANSEDPLIAATAADLAGRAGIPSRPAIERAARSKVRNARIRAALALARAGERERARALLLGSLGAVASPAPAAGEPSIVNDRSSNSLGDSLGSLGSAFVSSALELRTWLVVDPKDSHVDAIAARLLPRLEDPKQLTTYEMAHGLLALRTYFAAFGLPQSKDLRVNLTITVGGNRIERSLSNGPGGESLDWTATLRGGESIVVGADGPVFGVFEVVGRRAPPSKSASADLTIRRTIHNVPDDLPILPGAAIERGRLYEVVLRGHAERDVDGVAIIDSIAAGCEGENRVSGIATDRVEIRDGGAFFFVDHLPAGDFELRYPIRATFRGAYEIPPARCEALYRPGIVAWSSSALSELVVR